MLPVVLYNGRSPWKAVDDVAKLLAPVDEPLARYQPSFRYFVLLTLPTSGVERPGPVC